jgi:tryptophan 7-halogenase
VSETSTGKTAIERIVVCGGGLAAHMTAAALARQLPRSIQITWVNDQSSRDADLFFGGLTAPSAYAFNLAAGVSEPRLILDTDSTFSWGTRYQGCGAGNRAWVQCFHLPLPIVGGVLFHHHLRRHGIGELEPFLMPAVAARHGVFAHPVEKGPKLLARAEYGYQFSPYSYGAPFAAAARGLGIEVITADVTDVECREGRIFALHLSDDQALKADLFVDCTGPDARLLSRQGADFTGARRLRAVLSHRAAQRTGPPCRMVTPAEFGWHSQTTLQGSLAQLTVYAPESEDAALAEHGLKDGNTPQHAGEVTLGRRTQAWVGNCVGLGHAAGILEPLTHAPMLLLQREIERLLTLVPCSGDMSVECREFNRQSAEDHTHAEIFNRALFETPPLAQTPYWLAAREEPLHEKLAHKITQFESRGVLVAFDLEPLNAEDWTILHHGMGRRPARYDRVADRVPEAETRPMLDRMPREIAAFVKTMPTHHDYMVNLVRYLKQKKL